jgi:hypothetical protein
MHGAVCPLPNAPSWRRAQFKRRGQLYLHLTKILQAYLFITSKHRKHEQYLPTLLQPSYLRPSVACSISELILKQSLHRYFDGTAWTTRDLPISRSVRTQYSTTQRSEKNSCPSAEFEPGNPVFEGPKTHHFLPLQEKVKECPSGCIFGA